MAILRAFEDVMNFHTLARKHAEMLVAILVDFIFYREGEPPSLPAEMVYPVVHNGQPYQVIVTMGAAPTIAEILEREG